MKFINFSLTLLKYSKTSLQLPIKMVYESFIEYDIKNKIKVLCIYNYILCIMDYIPDRREISTDCLILCVSNLVSPPLSTYFGTGCYRTCSYCDLWPCHALSWHRWGREYSWKSFLHQGQLAIT